MREKLCLALDNIESEKEIKEIVYDLKPYFSYFKIGMGAFTHFGPSVVKLLLDRDVKVFLDLKFHDIPNTVHEAVKRAYDLGVSIVNVHASGGRAMMEAAAAAVAKVPKENRRPDFKLIAVTLLTSLDQQIVNEELRMKGSLEDQVLHLFNLSREAGLDGIVCSGLDLINLGLYKKDPSFFYITPGISLSSDFKNINDQKRVLTAGEAIAAGSSLLVIGRAILKHKDPFERIKIAKAFHEDIQNYV